MISIDLMFYILSFRVACASYGGPVAMIRDERKMVQVTGGARPTLRIYSAAGRQMGAYLWEQERIAAMGWTLKEELMVLDQSGEVHAPVLLEHLPTP